MKYFPLYLFLLLGSSLSLVAQSEWKLNKNRKGIKVYTRAVANSPLKEMRAVMKVDIPFEVVVEIMKKPEASCQWYGMCKKLSTVQKQDSWRKYDMYFVLDMPVVVDRDVVARVKSSIDYDKQLASTQSKSLESDYKKDSGLIRMKKMYSSFQISREQNLTVIEYKVFSEIGGDLPAWIINLASLDHPYKTMLGLQTEGLKEKHWLAAEKLHNKKFREQYPNFELTK